MTDVRVALVTGGSSGIGLATARAFRDQGWSVAVCGRDGGRLAAVDDGIHAVQADMADAVAASRAVDETVERFGRLDAVVCAHGVIGNFKPIEKLTAADWLEVLQINLLGQVNATQAAIPHLRSTRGAVVLVSSVNAHQAEPVMAPYGASKAALVNFAMYAARELAADGIRVNCIAPGWVLTPMAQPFFEEAGLLGKPVAFNMLGRPGEPEEIASVAVFLAGPGASFMTGTTVIVDGGMVTQMAGLEAAGGD
jgi:meso-butanediol dehydrogenase/(S,S)-butanediol dehydrogenase/diacetyl reductase